MSHAEKLLAPDTRPKLVVDCIALIDSEMRSKSGLSGMALKGAYMLVKGVKPGFVGEVIDTLLDDWVGKLSPFLDTRPTGTGLDAYLGGQRGAVAEKLLEVTDAKAARGSGPVIKAYEKLRPAAKRHVEDAVPGLGAVVDKHLE